MQVIPDIVVILAFSCWEEHHSCCCSSVGDCKLGVVESFRHIDWNFQDVFVATFDVDLAHFNASATADILEDIHSGTHVALTTSIMDVIFVDCLRPYVVSLGRADMLSFPSLIKSRGLSCVIGKRTCGANSLPCCKLYVFCWWENEEKKLLQSLALSQ